MKRKLLISHSTPLFLLLFFFKQEDSQFSWVLKIFPSKVGILSHNNMGCLWALVSVLNIDVMRNHLWLTSNAKPKSLYNTQLYFWEMLNSFRRGRGVMLQTVNSFSLIFYTVSEFILMPNINSSISMASYVVLIMLSK